MRFDEFALMPVRSRHRNALVIAIWCAAGSLHPMHSYSVLLFVCLWFMAQYYMKGLRVDKTLTLGPDPKLAPASGTGMHVVANMP